MGHLIEQPVFPTIITMTTAILIIIIITIIRETSASQITGLSDGKTLYNGEYCLMETFVASCPQQQQPKQPPHDRRSTHGEPSPQISMVIMKRAKYGRMKEGRCMRRNYDEKGCNTDVLDILDRKCSAQRSCNVTLPDPDLFETKPCPEDLNPYLEASYYCVSVNFLDKDTCLRIGHVLLTSSEGYLTGQSESFLHLRHHHLKLNPHDIGRMTYCSYVIEMLPGQRVNLSIINFAREPAPRHQLRDDNFNSNSNINRNKYYHQSAPSQSSSSSSSSSSGHHHHHHHHRNRHPQLEHGQPHMVEVCSNVAMVYEDIESKERNSDLPKTSTTSLSVCTGDEREKLVHVSHGYRVRVEYLNVGGNSLKQTNFLLRYKASGCASSIKQANEDMWFQRESGVMKVGCNSTNEIWYMACKDGNWDGILGNCTSLSGDATDSGWKLKQMLNMEDSLPFGMFLVVAMGVAIGVIIGSLLLCTIAMVTKRHRRFLIKPGHHLQQQRQQQQILQQPQQRSRLNSFEEHRDSTCFYHQDQSSIPLQHHPSQQYYHRCHHGQHQDDMGDCRCCSQRETAALLADSRHGVEDVGGKNPSTPMVIRDAVKSTHCQPKETVLGDLEIFDGQKSTHSAYQYHQLMLISSGRQKNPGEPTPMKPKQHPPLQQQPGDLIKPHVPCNEHVCSMANSTFNYQ